MADAEFVARVHARAARQADARRGAPAAFVPPGPPVPAMQPAEPAPADPGPPVAVGAPGTQKERTRRLHDDLAEVINAHAASPETVLMALALLRHQAIAPRLRQIEME